MYQYQSSWIDGADIHVASRPDALLASRGAFLPLAHQQQEEISPPEMAMFRRAMSSGDLTLIREEEQQPRVVASPARYSAEERRERIDKYRSKRNHRNFQKKITYACRKTLADTRPRVKGRFARGGGDFYADPEAEVVQAAGASESESPPVNDVVTGEGSDSSSMPEWCPAMQEALATGVDLDNLCDEEMLAAYLGVSSII